ncbi:MAG TPA: CADD family putative folate metabolism protein [Terriglobia bacterium]|jgi:pyrroloquinoline-quinone synthase|nr:CADD family putative folate metabolism protein [Terriglobia bacterium]
MDEQNFFEELDRRIAKYSLLCHPFYRAWTSGGLTRDDLGHYAAAYYHHVAAFPTYLSAFHSRLPDGALRRAVLHNLWEEEIDGVAHSELWLDFAEGMGNGRDAVKDAKPIPQVEALIGGFRAAAREKPAAAVLAALYAYESQVPEIAKVKAEGLRAHYGADERACRYFTVHETADVHHSRVWAGRLARELQTNPESAGEALEAAESAARSLWGALDGIEERRQARRARAH